MIQIRRRQSGQRVIHHPNVSSPQVLQQTAATGSPGGSLEHTEREDEKMEPDHICHLHHLHPPTFVDSTIGPAIVSQVISILQKLAIDIGTTGFQLLSRFRGGYWLQSGTCTQDRNFYSDTRHRSSTQEICGNL